MLCEHLASYVCELCTNCCCHWGQCIQRAFASQFILDLVFLQVDAILIAIEFMKERGVSHTELYLPLIKAYGIISLYCFLLLLVIVVIVIVIVVVIVDSSFPSD